jgi:hypothetical protein
MTEPVDYPPYQRPPEAGYDFPPVQWMPPHVYDHQLEYADWLWRGVPPPPPPPEEP